MPLSGNNNNRRALTGGVRHAQVQALPSGAVTLTFGAKSDPLSQDISALVVHLYSSDVKQEPTTGKAPALAAVTEVCRIRCA